MQSQTISNYFENELSELEVEAAIFTTYNLDLSFFECEIIPLLFSTEEGFSNDERIKTIQIREELMKSHILIDLFFDETVFDSSQRMPMMEYGFFGVRHGAGAFHAKTALVLGKNVKDGERELLVFAGSNNITKSGWWDNVETINALNISRKEPPGPDTLKALKGLMGYLLDEAKIKPQDKEEKSALTIINGFIMELDEMGPAKDEEAIFYFSHGTNFRSFLEQHLGPGYTTVEIISPYFPDEPKSKLFQDINACGKIFLPLRVDGDKTTAQCTELFYSHMRQKGFTWAQFKNEIKQRLEPDDQSGHPNRYVHAKLYMFNTSHSKEKWAFAGSVNFTHKAFFDNIEAGFLFKTQVDSLLDPIGEETSFGFLPGKSDVHTVREEDADVSSPGCDIRLFFDWRPDQNGRKTLAVYGEIPQDARPCLNDHEGKLLLKLSPHKKSYKINEDAPLGKHLEKNGYVRLVCDGQQREIYVQQRNWDYKPLTDYPALTVQDIVKIYTSMKPAVLREHLYKAKEKELIQQKEGNEYTVQLSTGEEEADFFSAYAELFYAFRQVRNACKNDKQRDYYLLSHRPDSLPSMMKAAQKKDDIIDHVIRYLVLLSAKELYDLYKIPFKFEGLLGEIRNDFVNRNSKKGFDAQKFIKFIEWFENEFFKKYHPVMES